MNPDIQGKTDKANFKKNVQTNIQPPTVQMIYRIKN